MGGWLNKQGNLLTRLVLGGHKKNSFPTCPPESNFYIEALSAFSHLYGPDSLHPTFLSQGWILAAASESGEGKQITHSKDRGVVGEPLVAWVWLTDRTRSPLPLCTLALGKGFH